MTHEEATILLVSVSLDAVFTMVETKWVGPCQREMAIQGGKAKDNEKRRVEQGAGAEDSEEEVATPQVVGTQNAIPSKFSHSLRGKRLH